MSKSGCPLIHLVGKLVGAMQCWILSLKVCDTLLGHLFFSDQSAVQWLQVLISEQNSYDTISQLKIFKLC